MCSLWFIVTCNEDSLSLILGAIFAVIAFAENVCSLVSSVINGAIYSNTVSFMRGFVFLVCAGYYVIPLVLLG